MLAQVIGISMVCDYQGFSCEFFAKNSDLLVRLDDFYLLLENLTNSLEFWSTSPSSSDGTRFFDLVTVLLK